ncbi:MULTISPECIES: lytic murein transglycosylase [Legionella]|uniref:Lytic murein transglycosylase n=1 Tax=Legionella septentrionalis TaxID=2498109 RepID=A0A433JIC0_9GAMM|nr:lytic murein transglycosylase [Legionella septentrionalis]RUQ95634.1 lytic murein transglycosylase [Legionella septentrionalis]RUR09559.1 lytic murein transglycosylase [Legionella septentrionalis]RUR13875.1 lytic murein transglycosylase [Legionella septentrionalis]
MKKWQFILMWVGLLTAQNALANVQSWNQWVAEVREEAINQGISAALFDEAFADIHEPSRQVKSLARSQPEHRLTYLKYRNSRVDNYRIAVGRKEYKKNKEVADKIAAEYGVDPCFIMAFWGMETSYGSYMGNFPVIKSLATLAYDSNRRDFFRQQLFYALHIVNDGHVPLHRFKGEWAGASGQPQFLPSSWVKYAVDYDRDGRKDIWDSKPDVFASIANYMKLNGWQTGQPWAVLVKLPANFDMNLEGKNTVKPVSEWNAMGVRTEDGKPLPHQELQASIVQPYGGPVFLAYANYKMILRYNNSIYYAGAIGYLADKICQRIP